MCLEIYDLDSTHFPTAPTLAWQAAINKNQNKVRSFS